MPQKLDPGLIKMFLWHGTMVTTTKMIAYQLVNADDLSKTSSKLYSSSFPIHLLEATSYQLVAIGNDFQIILYRQLIVSRRHWSDVKQICLAVEVRASLAVSTDISQLSASTF